MTKDSGFHIIFDNNWQVSAQWQPDAYVQEGAEFPIVTYFVECAVHDSEGNAIEWFNEGGVKRNKYLTADQFALLLANVKAAGPLALNGKIDSSTMEVCVRLSDEETGGNPFV